MKPPSSLPVLAQVPPTLRDLLRRERAMTLAWEHLSAAFDAAARHNEELSKTKPPFLFLQPRSTRTQFITQVEHTESRVVALSRGIQKMNTLRPRLEELISDELESFLRASQPAYLVALATHSLPGDWSRFVPRLNSLFDSLRVRAEGLIHYLAQLPPAMDPTLVEPIPVQLAALRTEAALLDAEFSFFNRVADQQRRIFELGTNTLHRQPEPRCADLAAHCAGLDAGHTRAALQQLIETAAPAVKNSGLAYADEARLCVIRHPGDIPSFHALVWGSFRIQVSPEVSPAVVETMMAETENLLAARG